jgi:hypothetical protein
MARFTSWGTGDIEVLPVGGRRDLALVPEEDVEEMLDVFAMETFRHTEWEEVPSDLARALAIGLFRVTDLETASDQTVVGARSVARVGYMARFTECQRLPAARRQRGWMIAGLREAVEASVAEELRDTNESFYDALGEVTAFFVRREPLDVPYDAEEGFNPMWTIPGMGGDFRALLRDRTLEMALEEDEEDLSGPSGPIVDATFEDLQLVWKYGFLLRAFEEFFQED